MKKALGLFLLTAAGLAAQASASTGTTVPKTAKKTAAARKATVSQPLTIPKEAVANADGTYSWQDKQGKNWTFVKTPFGVMKTETAAGPATTSASLAGVKAFDEGDKVRFERPSPFGVIKWEKNKTDLTDEERSLWEAQSAKQD